MTLRLRLALWYGALLAIVLAAALTVTFAIHAATHEADVDNSLRTSWEHAVAEVGGPLGMPMAMPMMATLSAPAEAASAPTALWILDQGGAVMTKTGAVGDPLLTAIAPAQVADGLRDVTLAGGRVRAYAGAVPRGGRIVVAASMAAFDDSLGRLGIILALMGVAGIAVAVGGGWAISAGALRPIAQLTETARAIALSRGFSRRLPVRPAAADELSLLGHTFNEMLASLDDAYRRQQRFVADVSHELRTPLTAIQGDLELLSGGRLPPGETALTLAEALHESKRLARLIDDLLVLARADAGPQPFLGRPVSLDEVVMEVFRGLRAQAGPRLRVVDLEAAAVSGERDRLKQLVLILVDNALSYTPGGGEVRLAVTREGSEVLLRVDDDGIGISEEVATHAFERFYRGSEAQRLEPAGTGLGLSIARWIVERHGGSMALEPRESGGARATVRLPATALPETGSASTRAASAERSAEASRVTR